METTKYNWKEIDNKIPNPSKVLSQSQETVYNL